MGCLPVVMALMNSDGCYGKYNDAAISFNSKVVKQLSLVQQELGVKSAYLDIYRVIEQVAENPLKYGKLYSTTLDIIQSYVFEI